MFESTGGDFGQWLSNLFTGRSNVMSGPASTGDTPSMAGADFSAMANAGYTVPGSGESSVIPSGDSSGGMNWAGLSQGLGKLADQLKGGTSASNQLQDSKAVASTVSGGVLQPQAASGGASALASADAARQQLGQYLILAAMQGKGRGRSGGGLLG